MARFEVKQSAKLNLTSYSGLALIGQCCQAAQVGAVIDPRLPVSQGMRTSDVVKSMVGLLSLGKSDFEAIEPFRSDRFFKEALGLSKVPGSVWIRQRLDAKAAELRELTDELSVRLLERAEAPITAHKGYVCADLDTFVMDNSDTKKEEVSRTYQGVDGYTPIALYLGNEGWNIGLELRAGSHHSALETEYFLERAFPRLERLCPKEAKVLWRDDSAFDSARLLFAKASMAIPRSPCTWATKAGILALNCARGPTTRHWKPSISWNAPFLVWSGFAPRKRRSCGVTTAPLTAPACCLPRPANATAGWHWIVPLTSSPSGIQGNRTRMPGLLEPRPLAPLPKHAPASG